MLQQESKISKEQNESPEASTTASPSGSSSAPVVSSGNESSEASTTTSSSGSSSAPVVSPHVSKSPVISSSNIPNIVSKSKERKVVIANTIEENVIPHNIKPYKRSKPSVTKKEKSESNNIEKILVNQLNILDDIKKILSNIESNSDDIKDNMPSDIKDITKDISERMDDAISKILDELKSYSKSFTHEMKSYRDTMESYAQR